MKLPTLIAALVLLTCLAPAHSMPVANENVANSGVLTIYPDHKDPNKFWIAPNIVKIARDPNGVPVFSYYDTRKSLFKTIGIMQMTLAPAFTQEDLEQAKAKILAKNPQAIFSGVPFIQSELVLTGDLATVISDHRCNHSAGLIGQEQSCVIELTNNGRYLFAKALRNRLLFTTLQFNYTVYAVRLKADGSFEDIVLNHGIAVRIDGDQLAGYPQLVKSLDI